MKQLPEAALEFLAKYTPPERLSAAFQEMAHTLVCSLYGGGSGRRCALLQHAAHIGISLHESAILVDLALPVEWSAMRHQLEPRNHLAERCLWAAAMAWRIVAVLDDRQRELDDGQLDALYQLTKVIVGWKRGVGQADAAHAGSDDSVTVLHCRLSPSGR